MSGKKYSYDENWLVLVIVTCILTFTAFESAVFSILGMTSTVPWLVPGYKALMTISLVTGSAAGVMFFYTRSLKR